MQAGYVGEDVESILYKLLTVFVVIIVYADILLFSSFFIQATYDTCYIPCLCRRFDFYTLNL